MPIFILHLLLSLQGEAQATSSKQVAASICPPFPSSPPFPFSANSGCGLPSFLVNCSSPFPTITINSISFYVLDFRPNSSIAILSPCRSLDSRCAPLFPSIPSRPINFSNSPFRLSNPYCSHLASLNSCTRPSSPNCTRCPFYCSLVDRPINLLAGGCESTKSEVDRKNSGICQDDVLGYLQRFLSDGFEVEINQRPGCIRSTGSNFWKLPLVICLLFIFLIIAAIVYYRRLTPFDVDQTVSILHSQSSPDLLPHVFSYEELEHSTGGFNPKRIIGDGGFGSVYLGILQNGAVVAVKCLRNHAERRKKKSKSFFNEILILSSLDHPNLVKLYGYCSNPRGLLLVYDYVPNGTLADHLHHNKGSHPLTWQVRLEIAVQTAVAIEYLHSLSPPVVHRDVTSSNIFVERDMQVKLGDFGMSRVLLCEGGEMCVYTGPQGTPGYLDPEYHRSFLLTAKSDVYSFGVVLLELVTGLKAVDRERGKGEVALVDLVVSRIQTGMLCQVIAAELAEDGACLESVADVAELAFRCVAGDKEDRPDSREVAEMLKRIALANGKTDCKLAADVVCA